MARDTLLRLAAATTPISANGNGTPVSCEGGHRADIELEIATIPTDVDETLAIIVQAAPDGTNYFPICNFPTLTRAAVLADITTDSKSSFRLTRTAYIPRPTTPGNMVPVRLNYVVAGTTPSYAMDAWVAPLTSLAPPAIDEPQRAGLAQVF